jgi:hypothetical protein
LEELQDCIRVIKSVSMRWAGDVRNPYRILVGKPDEKRPLGRIVHREEIRVESCVEYDGRDWSHLARNGDH